MNRALKRISYSLITITFMLGLLYVYMDKEALELNADSRAKLDGQFIRLDMGNVHYQLEGDKNAETVVLVHGFSSPLYIYNPTFDYLKKHYHVVRFDYYGRGYSDRIDDSYEIALYVEQIDHLLNALQIKDPVNIVGLSMGGAVVTHFTNKYPDRVKQVSLIAPLFHTPNRADLKAVQVPGLGEYLTTTVMIPKMISGAEEFLHDPKSVPNWAEEFGEQTQYKGFGRALLRTARFLAGKNFESEYKKLGQLGKPVQLIWGENDQVIPISDAEKIRELVPKMEFHRIAQAGHLPHLEQKARVNPILHDFMRKTTRPAL